MRNYIFRDDEKFADDRIHSFKQNALSYTQNSERNNEKSNCYFDRIDTESDALRNTDKQEFSHVK